MKWTHEKLLKMHGKRITCEIEDVYIEDAKISVEYYTVYICQNAKSGGYNHIDKFKYNHAWLISSEIFGYESDNRGCTNIKLKEGKGSEAEMKTKGIEGRIIAKQAYINKETQRINTKTIYGASVQEINEDNRKTVVDGDLIENVYYISVDDEIIIDVNKPKLEISDTREEWCKVRSSTERYALMRDCGLISEEEFKFRHAEINIELEGLSNEVEYKLVWNDE